MTQNLAEFDTFYRGLLENDPEDHFNQLGISLVDFRRHWVKLSLEYRDALLANPETGALHGGAITALLDTCSGFAAGTARDKPGLGPTIDLRIDYMRSAEPGKVIYAEAEVYRSTKNIVFTRGQAYQGDSARPIAHCVANFAIIQPRSTEPDSAGSFPAKAGIAQ